MTPGRVIRRKRLFSVPTDHRALMGALMTAGAMAQETDTTKPTTLSEAYDTWTVQCANAQQEGQPARRQCQMSQELLQQDSRQQMLLFAVTKGGSDDNAKATLILPFGLRPHRDR